LVVYFMLFKIKIFRAILTSLSYFFKGENEFFNHWSRKLKGKLAEINSHQIVFFTHLDNVEVLNRVMQYIEKNEPTHRLKIVSVQNGGYDDTGTRRDLEVLDRAYPDIDIEYIVEEGIFNAAKIEELSKRWQIPVNYMFVGTPGKDAKFNMEDLGEVRLII
ncbi:MAG: APC family permease, partial [Leeuwenhoekiella sp.]